MLEMGSMGTRKNRGVNYLWDSLPTSTHRWGWDCRQMKVRVARGLSLLLSQVEFYNSILLFLNFYSYQYKKKITNIFSFTFILSFVF